jgi:hypothetical protein
MFVGAINNDLRSILAALAPSWRDLPVYVGCSGAFTIERLLAHAGVRAIHGNDVSLYSCALGHHLAGLPFRLYLADSRLAWLEPFLDPGLPTISTLLLCTTLFQFWERDNPYHRRMLDAYQHRFAELHAQTLAKVEKALAGVALRSFYAGDVVDFLAQAPEESVVLSFPPTYRGGYERLYQKMDAAFDWDRPTYALFTEDRFAALREAMQGKRLWLVSRDAPIPELAAYQVGLVQTSLRSKPVWVYSNHRRATLTQPHQRLDPVPYARVQDTISAPLTLSPLTQAELNTLRSEYLAPTIVPARVECSYGVFAGGRLAGAVAFNRPTFGGWCDTYLVTDFAVSAPIARLSKLVLAAAVSVEMRLLLEQRYAGRIATVGTTAFTDKPVSMKYRGLFDLVSRKPGQLNYVARAGRWTLEEALAWWTKTQSRTSKP